MYIVQPFQDQKLEFVWAEIGHLLVMKINFVGRIGLKMIAGLKFRASLRFLQAFCKIPPGPFDVKRSTLAIERICYVHSYNCH